MSSAGGPRYASLRDISGRDEMALLGAEPPAVSDLVEGLLVNHPGDLVLPGVPLTLSDRDRLVAALHEHCFGDHVECLVTCDQCGASFELTFQLSLMLRGLRVSAPADLEGPDESGRYRLPDGTRFRLPTTEDERAIAGLPSDQAVRHLLQRCVESGDPFEASAAVQEAMDGLAPLLSLGVPIDCAECQAPQEVEFDMVRFFLSAVARERAILLREIHAIAASYHWRRDEILDLTRSERRAFVSLILPIQETRGSAA
jgi:hypothetical protein